MIDVNECVRVWTFLVFDVEIDGWFGGGLISFFPIDSNRLHPISTPNSCHSGSVMDLPFSYKVDGSEEIIQVDNTQAAIGSLANAGLAYLTGNKAAAIACAIDGVGSLLFGNKTNEAARRRTEQENQSAADVIQIGGCRDDQTSADARIDGALDGCGCVVRCLM